MQKRRVTKSDGRYIIYYAFRRPLPEVYPDQTAEGGGGPSPAGEGDGGQVDASLNEGGER